MEYPVTLEGICLKYHNKMITIYTITYNESLLIQFMIDHYRSRFPDCRIVVYDNMSTDETVKIALANGCEVIPFDTDNQYQDRRLMDIKNSCWKEAKTDWVLMCDLDELLDINEAELKMEEDSGTSIITPEGYNMVDMKDGSGIADMKYGARCDGLDKFCLFNKKFINEINYGIGCHECNPQGSIAYSNKPYKLYHYCFINENMTVEKRRAYGARLSPENLETGWSGHYLFTPEETHDEYVDARSRAIKVR